MGSGASHILFDYQYVNERKTLRQNLIAQFEEDPKNQDLLTKIKLVRDILTQNSHICETAARELEHDEDTAPTNPQSAYNELDRLLTIYETSTILKSVQCRIGPVACPLGHYAGYFDNFDVLAVGKKKLACHICKKIVNDGYHCSYCVYNLCVPCSVIYCTYAHPMKLWTHPESDHYCEICNKQRIHSGYRCIECDIDYCDYCTWKDGRQAVQQIILDRMAKDLEYIEGHQEESETALKTIVEHKRKVAEGSYPTTKHLYEFSLSLHTIKEICEAEVRQTRITRAIIKYRAVLTYGKEYSKTAYEESLIIENYTQDEKERLERLLKIHEDLKSVTYRQARKVACPLGHGCEECIEIPKIYRSRLPDVKKTSRPDVLCRVCRRNAIPGSHCGYCEYDICKPCSVIFCAEGHPMTMWTEPASIETCFLCQKTPIVSGYRCNRCNVDLCDLCTAKEGRQRIRTNWETEMNELLQFMQLNKRDSDIALFYEWRHANQIASIGLLVDYVKELRTAKKKAEKQIQQKTIIDKIKIIRNEIIKYPDLCITATKEATRSDIYVFANRQKAMEELKRLSDLLKTMILAQSPDERAKYGVACPLSHGMIPIELTFSYDDFDQEEGLPTDAVEILDDIEESDKKGVEVSNSLISSDSKVSAKESIAKDEKSARSLRVDLKDIASTSSSPSSDKRKMLVKHDEHSTPLITPWKTSSKKLDNFIERQLSGSSSRPASPTFEVIEKPGSPTSSLPRHTKKKERACRICASTTLNGGHTCTICEYDLCSDCSIVYCRSGHPLKIWTMPEAQSLYCDLCKSAPIISGYRCVTCNIDICDMCTTRESRNAFMLWPRREFHRIMDYLQSMKEQSKIAQLYLEENDSFTSPSSQPAVVKEYLNSMSKLCKKLQEVMEVKRQVEREIENIVYR